MEVIILIGVILIIMLLVALIVQFALIAEKLECYYESIIDSNHEVIEDLVDLDFRVSNKVLANLQNNNEGEDK